MKRLSRKSKIIRNLFIVILVVFFFYQTYFSQLLFFTNNSAYGELELQYGVSGGKVLFDLPFGELNFGGRERLLIGAYDGGELGTLTYAELLGVLKWPGGFQLEQANKWKKEELESDVHKDGQNGNLSICLIARGECYRVPESSDRIAFYYVLYGRIYDDNIHRIEAVAADGSIVPSEPLQGDCYAIQGRIDLAYIDTLSKPIVYKQLNCYDEKGDLLYVVDKQADASSWSISSQYERSEI